jgi:hypothetical protein
MPDPIPRNDPNEAYDVIPMREELHGPRGWWTITSNGILVRHVGDKAKPIVSMGNNIL